MTKKKAIVLLSGGLDSTTTLFYAIERGFDCCALVFDYGQRHRKELKSAAAIAKDKNIPFTIIKIKLPWKGSSLLEKEMPLPVRKKMKGIPSTYVPARNTIFISFALSYAEAVGAGAIFIGANAVDFSGYPDCRPAYYQAFQKLIEKATKKGDIMIIAPLLNMTKKQIIKLGMELGAPLHKTWSCYAGGKMPCGVCDSCQLRERGFSLYNKVK